MGEVLGVPPTQANIDRLAGSKVLGDNRDRVTSAMHEAGVSGQYGRMNWDADTRTVEFHSEYDKNVTSIDTTSVPPTRKMELGGLSVSEKIPEPSGKNLERTDLLRDRRQTTNERKNISTELLQTANESLNPRTA